MYRILILTIMREVKTCFIFFGFTCIIYEGFSETLGGLEATPERAEITYSNDKYVSNSSLNVRRNSRRGRYVVNVWGILKHTWANNVTVDVIFYEYLHNEYKRSFVEMHYKLCDLINKDQLIGAQIRKHKIPCPIPPGMNGIYNATLSVPTFPYVFPFEKCKAEIILRTEPSHDLIGKGDLFVVVKQLPKKRAKIH